MCVIDGLSVVCYSDLFLSHRALHRGADVGRQIGRGPHDQLKHAVEKLWKHAASIILGLTCTSAYPLCRFEPSATLSVSSTFPPMRTTASRPPGRSRISASATCARPPIWSPPRS